MARATKLNIAYWIVTLLVLIPMTWSALHYLIEEPRMMQTMVNHLGYPVYFTKILAIFKLFGVLAILTGALPLMKEWAYAGFCIDVVGAFASHLSVGDPFGVALVPLAFLVLTLVSYSLWKKVLQARAYAVPSPRHHLPTPITTH